MYRCPSCRARKQFYVRRLGYRYIVKDNPEAFKSDDYEVVLKKDLITRFLDLFRKPLFGEVTEAQIMWIAQKSEHKMKCSACGHVDDVAVFSKCYTDPMSAYDTSNLCDCGGEVWQDFEVGTPQADSSVEYDGDQRRAISKVRSVIRCERCGKEAK